MTQLYFWSLISTHSTLLKFGILGLHYKLSSRVLVFTQMQVKVFTLKYCVEICDFILNLRRKCQTGLFWTGPCRAKPRHVLPNDHEWSLLFWDITQCRVVTVTNISGPVISPILKGQEIENREQSMTEVNWHSLSFFLSLFFVHCLIFLKKCDVSSVWDIFSPMPPHI